MPNSTVTITFTIDPNFIGTTLLNVAEISSSTNALGLPDADAPEDQDNTNDAGGNPNSPSDNSVNGDGTGTPGDSNASTDEDNSDPAIISLSCSMTANVTPGADILCNGASTGSATAVATNGAGVLTYLWSNGSTDATATGLAAGSYTVTITDANFCTATAVVTITEPALLEVVCAGSDPSGPGLTDGFAQVTATGGSAPYSYLWSNMSTTSTITGIGVGSYTVTVTDANGCTSSCEVALNESPSFDLALRKVLASAGPFGAGSNVTFNITVYNQGNLDGTNIQVTDYIPTGLGQLVGIDPGGLGGVASTINGMCSSSNKYCYSDVDYSYNTVTYLFLDHHGLHALVRAFNGLCTYTKLRLARWRHRQLL